MDLKWHVRSLENEIEKDENGFLKIQKDGKIQINNFEDTLQLKIVELLNKR